MLTGNTTNNPWRNAVNHARNVQSEKALIKKLTVLSTDYTQGTFIDISNQNIILGSTIFDDDITKIEKDIMLIQNYLANHQSQEELVICLNVQAFDTFEKILGEIANG